MLFSHHATACRRDQGPQGRNNPRIGPCPGVSAIVRAMTDSLRLGWRTLWRDLRAGELRLLIVAVLLKGGFDRYRFCFPMREQPALRGTLLLVAPRGRGVQQALMVSPSYQILDVLHVLLFRSPVVPGCPELVRVFEWCACRTLSSRRDSRQA